MSKRKTIIRTIIDALNGLAVETANETKSIAVYDTLFDPSTESTFPCFCVVPAPENVALPGLSRQQMDVTLQLEIMGFVDTLGVERQAAGTVSEHFDSVENLVEAIKQALTSSTFTNSLNCMFAIKNIGPIVTEHAGPEHPYPSIRIALIIEYIDEGV